MGEDLGCGRHGNVWLRGNWRCHACRKIRVRATHALRVYLRDMDRSHVANPLARIQRARRVPMRRRS